MAAWAYQRQACHRIKRMKLSPQITVRTANIATLSTGRRREYSPILRTLTYVWSKQEQNHPETNGYRRRATEQNPGNNRPRQHILV